MVNGVVVWGFGFDSGGNFYGKKEKEELKEVEAGSEVNRDETIEVGSGVNRDKMIEAGSEHGRLEELVMSNVAGHGILFLFVNLFNL
ncbi:hypothetical protein GOBAR_AA01701 [Gossypium barbadense]|uniref:Uncharacterized protein n=1 Tax=Gossypium barbadense TaxID=3634 RepID=A0A2P5YTE9_GOSBA|nr:hypothetical protein GOBAR_AA01701 [Gossypium barbadense]